MIGSKGMGMSKHRKSGKNPVSSRQKITRQMQAEKLAKQDKKKSEMYSSVKELMKDK